MDPQAKALLEENVRLARENNLLLQKLFRAERTRNITRYVYWGIIVVFTIGSLFFLKPLLGNVLNVYTGGGLDDASTSNANSTNSAGQMQDLLNSLK